MDSHTEVHCDITLVFLKNIYIFSCCYNKLKKAAGMNDFSLKQMIL